MAEFRPGIKASAQDRRSKLIWAIGVLAALFTFLVYLPALDNNFVNWDDQMYVYENGNIRHIDLEFLKWVFRPDVLDTFFHPLPLISYAIDYQILGLNPFQYHLTNVIFHALNTFLVFYLAVRLYEIAVRPGATRSLDAGSVTAGLVTALLFAIHPLHVESVAWISERKDVLYAFFFLLSILSYLKFVRPRGPRKAFHYALSLFFFALSLMSKPMAVTLPAVLLILDWYPLNRFSDGHGAYKRIKAVVLEKVPFFAISLLSALLTIIAFYGKGHVAVQIPFLVRAFVAVRAYVFYIYKMFVPFDLAPVYPYPQEVIFFEYMTIVPLAAFVLIAVLAVLMLRRGRYFSAALLSYFLMLLPVIGIIPNGPQFAADRYTYLPLLGFFMLAGFGAAKLAEKVRGYARVAVLVPAVLVIFALSSLTIKQIEVWDGPVSMWTQQLKLYPNQHVIFYCYRAFGYASKGDFANAAKDYTAYMASKKFNPKNASLYVSRGIAYMESKDFDSAVKDFDKALEIKPDYARAMFARGVLNTRAGRYAKAVADLKDGLRIQPENAFAIYNLGTCYEKLGMREEAGIQFKKATELGLKVSGGVPLPPQLASDSNGGV